MSHSLTEAQPAHQFAVDGGSIAYELLEPAHPDVRTPLLVLIHNFMSTGRAAWGPLLSAFSQRFRILLPDLPGHGRSVGHPTGYHHWATARQLAELIQSVQADAPLHVGGCSSGGMLAQLLVHHRMVRPQSLSLVSTTYSTDPRRTGATRALLPERFEASPTWMEATARLHNPYQGEGYYERELLPGFRALTPDSSVDLTLEDLSRFTMPVCIVHGERDEFFPVQIAQDMAHAIPNAELHVIPRQSHALIFRQPWKVAAVLAAFLEHAAL